MKTRTDKTLLILTALFVTGLAIVAGAVSFAHMRELAIRHDQFGWKSYAFPISVDGLEIVASLYLVAQRRAGRPTGWVPWVALIVGTVASLAANVAVGGADPIGKALAGWPALSMLVSIKLLFAMLDHGDSDHDGGDQRTVPDDQRTSPTVPDVRGTVHRTGRDDQAPSGTVAGQRTTARTPTSTVPADRPTEAIAPPGVSDGSVPGIAIAATRGDFGTVAQLIPAARAARATLTSDGRSLSRDNLADAMREDGHGVSNARASLLLKILKAEQGVAAIVPIPAPEYPRGADSLSEVAA